MRVRKSGLKEQAFRPEWPAPRSMSCAMTWMTSSRYRIAPSQIPDEIGRFETALIQTRMQILEMQQRIAESIGAKDAAIFDAHLLVVEDRTLIDEVLRKLETDLCNVEWVFQEVATRYAETLNKIDDPYLRERALDIQDVTKRVIRNLQGKAPKTFLALSEPHILVAHNLTPSDTASINRANVLGIATDLGSRTSHAAILARSLNIPAVVGLHDITAKLETGQHVLVDGSDGLLIVDPAPETIAHYAEIESRRARVVARLQRTARRQDRPRAMVVTLCSPQISNCRKTSRPSQPTARRASDFIAPNFFI